MTTPTTRAVARITELYAWASAASAAGAYAPSAIVERIRDLDPFLFWAVAHCRTDLVLLASESDAWDMYERDESIGPDPLLPHVKTTRGRVLTIVWPTSTDTVLDVSGGWAWVASVTDPDHYRATAMHEARTRAASRADAWRDEMNVALRRPRPPVVVPDVRSVPDTVLQDRW